MPRPRMQRTVRDGFPIRVFKPQGVPMRAIKRVVLSLDGAEALRFADAEGLEHVAAAELMGISRPTFSRLLAEARTIVASALAGGWAIEIAGGPVVSSLEAAAPGCDGGIRRRRGHRRCTATTGLSGLAAAPHPEQENDMPNHDGTGPRDGCGCGNGNRHQNRAGHGHDHGKHEHGAGEHCCKHPETEAAVPEAPEPVKD